MTAELELRGITKRFPGVLACDRVDLKVRTGEVHCIVGENGAGKSTLMSVLYGMEQPDAGTVVIRGQPAAIRSPLHAIELGIGMVHQAFKLFPSLTVAENVVFRQEPSRAGVLDRRAANRQVRELADTFGLALDPDARVEDLPVGVLQRLEIVKALYREASVLILDEPTAVLTPHERDRLFTVIRRLRDAGRTIVFITHKLAEVMAVADRITVLRQGRAVAELVPSETTPGEISQHMTGRDVVPVRRSGASTRGDAVLEVQRLEVANAQGLTAVDKVSFDVHGGEVVGIAAVAGNGQSQLIEAISGLRSARAGAVRIAGHDVTDASVARRRETGLSYVPEDRHRIGTVSAASISDNLLMGYQRSSEFRRRGLLSFKAVHRHAERLRDHYRIRAHDVAVSAGTLSGGNLQKVVVAREMYHDSELLIAEQPTRGVDIGAIEFIHAQILKARDRGRAVLLVSAELSEIKALADRILVVFEGRIVAELDPESVPEAEIGLHMAGGANAGA